MATATQNSNSAMAGLGDRDGQAGGNRRGQLSHISAPAGSSLHHDPGNLLKGAVNGDGELKDASLMVGIKLDLEAEVHLTARVRGDITIGLY